MKEYTKEELIKAIKGSAGIISTIAKKLDCTWVTANTYCQKYEETKAALADENEAVLDLSETTVLQSIKGGDVQAAKWLLSTKGKKRGWGEKIEVEGNMNITIIDDVK